MLLALEVPLRSPRMNFACAREHTYVGIVNHVIAEIASKFGENQILSDAIIDISKILSVEISLKDIVISVLRVLKSE